MIKPHLKTIKARFLHAIQPFHFVAYILHPTFRGAQLSHSQREEANQYSSGCWRALSSVSGYYNYRIYGKHAAANIRWYLEYRQVCDFLRVRGLRLLHFWRSFNLLEVMWLRINCYFSACKRVRSPTMSGAMEYCTCIIQLNGCMPYMCTAYGRLYRRPYNCMCCLGLSPFWP